MEENNQLPLRLNVGVVLLNNKNQIFVAKRIDLKDGIIPNLTDSDRDGVTDNIDLFPDGLEPSKAEVALWESVVTTVNILNIRMI